MIKAFILGYDGQLQGMGVSVYLKDDEDTQTGANYVEVPGITVETSASDVYDAVAQALSDYCDTNTLPQPDTVEWLITPIGA